MALIEKFTQVANSFISLVRTRASIHLDNLSQEGLSKITTHAGGIPKTAVSNVITSSKDVDYTLIENSEGETLALQGEYIAYCPNGKWADGSMKSNEIEVALDGSHAVDISTATGTNAIMVSLEGVMSIHPYVVSFTTPKDAITNRIWYDLTHNQLKIYDGDWDVWHGFKVGTLIKNVGQDTKVILHNTVQLMDCATILDQIELAKVPVGTVIAYMGTDVPEGYLLMDGRLLSRTTYSRLFSVIGTTQGEGDGSTTFQIANMTDGRYLMGSTVAGGSVEASAPNISGELADTDMHGSPRRTGVFYSTGSGWAAEGGGSSSNRQYTGFNASRCWNGYSNVKTITVESKKCLMCVKY